MEMQDLQKKTVAQLQQLLAEKREELRALRFAVANMQNKDVRSIRKTRKEIARVSSALREAQKAA